MGGGRGWYVTIIEHLHVPPRKHTHRKIRQETGLSAPITPVAACKKSGGIVVGGVQRDKVYTIWWRQCCGGKTGKAWKNPEAAALKTIRNIEENGGGHPGIEIQSQYNNNIVENRKLRKDNDRWIDDNNDDDDDGTTIIQNSKSVRVERFIIICYLIFIQLCF